MAVLLRRRARSTLATLAILGVAALSARASSQAVPAPPLGLFDWRLLVQPRHAQAHIAALGETAGSATFPGGWRCRWDLPSAHHGSLYAYQDRSVRCARGASRASLSLPCAARWEGHWTLLRDRQVMTLASERGDPIDVTLSCGLVLPPSRWWTPSEDIPADLMPGSPVGRSPERW